MQYPVLLVEKTNIFKTSIGHVDRPVLSHGEILLEIEKFALTSNNITYAVIGFPMKYWNFFPAQGDWGIVPVWGFAKVIESKSEDVKVGERCYGYFPMGKILKVQVGRANDQSFMDVIQHRQEMARIYNTYMRLGKGKFSSEIEDYIPIFKPLFTTSFLNYHYLKSEDFFDAEQVIITSASSKTSLGVAYMFHENKEKASKTVIGLTSSKNVEFVKSTGFYDLVLEYNEIDTSLPVKPSLVIDMSGNAEMQKYIFELLGEKLKFVSKIGITDWTASSQKEQIPVAKFFFAPSYAEVFFKEKGIKEAAQTIEESLLKFIHTAKEWITIEHINDFENLDRSYREMVNGKVDPSVGLIVKA